MKTKTVYVVQSSPKLSSLRNWADRFATDDFGEAKTFKKGSEINSMNNWRIIKRTEEVVE